MKSIEEALDKCDDPPEPAQTGEEASTESDSEPEPTESTPACISRVYSKATISSVKANSFKPSTFDKPQVFQAEFQAKVRFGSGDIFRDHGPVHIYLRSSAKGNDTRVCADTGCGPTIWNRKVVQNLFQDATIHRRALHPSNPLKVRGGFDGKEYEYLPEYVAVDAFLVTTKGNLLNIKLEIHLSDATIDSGILVGSSALATERLIVDFKKEVLVSRNTKQNFSVKVPFYLNEPQGLIEDQPVQSTCDLLIPAGHEGLVQVDLSSLPNRSFMFEGRCLGKGEDRPLVRCADSAVDPSVKRTMVANMSDKPFHMTAGRVIGYVSEMRSDWANTVMRVNSIVDHRPWFSDFA